MHVASTAVRESKIVPAVFWGGLISGVLDLIYATTSVVLQGDPAIVLPQAIATGLLGEIGRAHV